MEKFYLFRYVQDERERYSYDTDFMLHLLWFSYFHESFVLCFSYRQIHQEMKSVFWDSPGNFYATQKPCKLSSYSIFLNSICLHEKNEVHLQSVQ